jgi:hypothetical protein
MTALYDVITNGIFIFSVFQVVFFIYNIRKFNGPFFVFVLWILASASIDAVSIFMAKYSIHNIYLIHVHSLIEYGLLIVFFDKLFTKAGKKSPIIMLYPGLALILFNSVFIQKIDTFNSYSLTAISFVVVLLCIYYFYVLSDLNYTLDKKLFLSITVGSVFILHTSSLIPLLFSNFLLNAKSENEIVIWLLRALIILIIKILTFYALLPYLFSKRIQI